MNAEEAGQGHHKSTCNLSLTGLGIHGRFLRIRRKEISILSMGRSRPGVSLLWCGSSLATVPQGHP